MRDDLDRYHGIERGAGRRHRLAADRRLPPARPRESSTHLLAGLGLDPDRPLVLVMGNTPTNAPFEAHSSSGSSPGGTRAAQPTVLAALPAASAGPEWRERFGAPSRRDGAAVQEPSFTDIETLAVLLQHGDCVVSNAGTILLDALVNDRPAVCVLYDEGAPPGESWAPKNVSGEHYRQLIESDAFYRADRFEEVAAGIERALGRPTSSRPERARVAREVLGEVDGRAAERVAEAILDASSRASAPSAAARGGRVAPPTRRTRLADPRGPGRLLRAGRGEPVLDPGSMRRADHHLVLHA